MTARTNFPGLKQAGGDTEQQVANVVNNAVQGKMNCTLAVTLTANDTTTVVTDPRIYSTSLFVFDPRTASAKLAAYDMYVSSVSRGTFTITHQNTADTDKGFIVGIFS